jgi:hypothetical protein
VPDAGRQPLCGTRADGGRIARAIVAVAHALGRNESRGPAERWSIVSIQPDRQKDDEDRSDDRLLRRLGHELAQKQAPATELRPVQAVDDQHPVDEHRMDGEVGYHSDLDRRHVEEAGQQVGDRLRLILGRQIDRHAVEREFHPQPTFDRGR